MARRLTRDGLTRLIKLEARRLSEAPMRSHTRGRHHGEGSAAMNARQDPTAEREDRVDDLSLDPRMVDIFSSVQSVMQDGYTIDDVIGALIALADPAPDRPL